MRLLITGGAGFVGANLTRRLLPHYRLGVYDDLSRGLAEHVPDGVDFVRGDIRDTAALAQAMQGIDVVVHLAAYGSVVDSVADPRANFSINVEGTFSVLDAARQARIRKLVFASTGGAIMGNAPLPVSEASLPKPISPYGAGKLCGEAYCHAFAHAYGIDTVCLRFANVYGPYSAQKKGVITQYIKRLFRDEPLVIYGDGSSTRDYLHVEDLCSGIAAAITAPTAPGEVLHLASGQETAVAQIATILKELASKPEHAVVHRPVRAGEVDRNCASFDKAARALGFAPRYSLREGLAGTWAWFVQHREQVLAAREADA